MYSLVKTFQRTHNSISTMHTRKQPTLPFFWLKLCAFFCCFICHLYCFLHVLLDDLIFHLCVSSSYIVPSLPLFPKTIKLRKKLTFEIHTSHCHFTAFFPCVTKFTEPSVVTLVCSHHFQLQPGSLLSCFLFSPVSTNCFQSF